FPLTGLDQQALDQLWDKGLIDRGTEDVYPLTPLQQGMVFHTLYEPGSAVYFQQLRLTLAGRLEARALEQSWRDLTARHEVLRGAALSERLPRPLLVIRRAVEPPFEIDDWSDVDRAEQERRLDELLAADRARGFDLGAPPLMRIALIRTGAESWELVWSFHHLLLDGWSMPLVLGEVFSRYHALAGGHPLDVRAAPSYRDYVAWLQGRDEDADERYWRERLAGFAAPTPLGIDRPRRDPEAGDGHGHALATLGADTTAALESLARRSRITLNTVVQGAWALLLSRYSGERDVVFGATVSGRPAELPGVQEMVGLFINTVPVRVSVDESATVRAWLERMQEEAIAQGEFEHAALTDIHAWSEVPAATPLFDSIVVFENYPIEKSARQDGEPAITAVDAYERTNYPLNLVVAPGPAMALAVNYDRGRFDPADVERLTGHLLNLLEAMAANAERPLSDLEVMSAPERHHLVAELNDTAAPYPADRCVHELFERQVRQSPDAVALTFGDDELTYSQLNAAANRLAHHLTDKGVGPGVTAGVCLERGPRLVVALLAVLKAGGAYVPLDPGYPAERLTFMLHDAGVRVVMTTSNLAVHLGGDGRELVLVDADDDVISTGPDGDPAGAASPGDLAYVIYTSGSTGAPKGVAVTHRGVVNYLTWCVRNYDLQPDRAVPLHTSASFDLSVTSLFAPLVAGAPVRVLPERTGESPLQEELEAGAAFSSIKLTPAHLTQLGRVLEPGVIGSCARCLVVGGEALTAHTVAPWLDHPGARLVNEYGPTETVVGCTTYEVSERDLEAATVPIGRPIINTAVYILDRRGNLVPKGVPGELYVGGTGVARSYVNRPALTAERFVPDPFSRVPGARLYRTGDRARYLPDGNIEFLGRVDHQVKIRGWRIEPGEIEACLVAHEAVRDAVVVARSDGGDRRLVAYVVGDVATATELRAHVSKTLPDYMVPAHFVVLDELPLTPAGKLDRAALPAPEGRPELEAAYAAPRTPAEEVLAEIWCEVLRLERVGIHDNFFELGGDSILSIQIVGRARDAFAVDLPLRALFDMPTIAALEAEIERLLLEEMDALSDSDASSALRSMSSKDDGQREMA
ncbi:MAG TPA: amino acid adenylation domain-containing protein, partial [Actinomycetota bacterium]|nr:amino acid adenylation domain-containing protein [Actinomycetota bacterium]